MNTTKIMQKVKYIFLGNVTIEPSSIEWFGDYNMSDKQKKREKWILEAINAAKRFAEKDFTNEQEIGIAAQFNVLMNQIDIAVEALQKIGDGKIHCNCGKTLFSDEIARVALKRMKS